MGKTKRHIGQHSSGGPEVGCEPHLSHSGDVSVLKYRRKLPLLLQILVIYTTTGIILSREDSIWGVSIGHGRSKGRRPLYEKS